jgi:hypothetical protein
LERAIVSEVETMPRQPLLDLVDRLLANVLAAPKTSSGQQRNAGRVAIELLNDAGGSAG